MKNTENTLKNQKLFASSVDHELRDSLSSINLRTESVLGDLETGYNSGLTKEKFEELIHTIKGDITELGYVANVVKNLSIMTSYQYGSEQMELSRVNLSKLLENLCESVARQTADAENIGVVFKADSQEFVMGNESALRQMFTNILKNAIYHTPKGGRVTTSLFSIKNRVVASVKDTGDGINPKDLPYVFEPFYKSQVPKKLKNKKGSGLGLAIVAEIAKQHGAKIQLESTVQEGTNMSVSFPVIAPVKKLNDK